MVGMVSLDFGEMNLYFFAFHFVLSRKLAVTPTFPLYTLTETGQATPLE